ncbi:hypothetical protein Rhal01_00710 [Rubritalea halochordaticola]|uniref:Verru_Chthon cassette protein A n=1 Tax=Rubritalea halochordaticola TaxID=714537 RepID=A0ABP9UWE0_9BACT
MKTQPIIKTKIDSMAPRGFALVSAMTVMILLVVVALGVMSLSSSTSRQSSYDKHAAVAEANARMALTIALNKLQSYAGPDQRVTANAQILSERESVRHPHWVGAWKTTVEENGVEYPVVGKRSDEGSGNLYQNKYLYTDVRQNMSTWRNDLLQGWLVSQRPQQGDSKQLHTQELDPEDPMNLRIVGEGTLGDKAPDSDHVVVEKVLVNATEKQNRGAYAWWVGDNNQKASLNLSLHRDDEDKARQSVAASPKNDPAVIDPQMKDYYPASSSQDQELNETLEKVVSRRSTELANDSPEFFKEHFHAVTDMAPGIHVDVQNGGLKKDLGALLLANPSDASVRFGAPNSAWPNSGFSSSDPIIPGSKHAMVGPNFDMLRSWMKLKDMSFSGYGTSGVARVQTSTQGGGSGNMWLKPHNTWITGASDGYTWSWEKWGQQAPVFHPVVTEARWNWFFTYSSTTGNLRLHILPRVCVWNPFNADMEAEKLVVMIENPFYKDFRGWARHMSFRPSNAAIRSVKAAYKSKDPGLANWNEGNGTIQMLMNEGIFPREQFLCFTLDKATIPAGECLVYSAAPKRKVTDLAGGVKVGEYDANNISTNLLSPISEANKDHFYYDSKSTRYRFRNNGLGEPYAPTVTGWKNFNDVRWRNIFRDLYKADPLALLNYAPWITAQSNFRVVLKGVNGSGAVSHNDLINGPQYPTLQMFNGSNGGSNNWGFFTWKYFFGEGYPGSSNRVKVCEGGDDILSNIPKLHVWGAKLLYFDESLSEANAPPLRVNRWGDKDHAVWNQALIGNWNVRSNYTARAPFSPSSAEWYMNSAGPWAQEFVPLLDSSDLPFISSNGFFAKPPMGRSNQFGAASSMVLFDLPQPKFGALSLGAFRHARLSPFSWHPTYVVGHSLAAHGVPSYSTAPPNVTMGPSSDQAATRWDQMNGGKEPFGYGPRTPSKSQPGNSLARVSGRPVVDSAAILQQQDFAVSGVKVEGQGVDVSDEIFLYDIAFEVNQNLWDQFFISSIPMNNGRPSWSPSQGDLLWNSRYGLNSNIEMPVERIESRLSSEGAEFAFWNSAYFVKNRGAFNVNSTSVEAWAAFLSGLRGVNRTSRDGSDLESSELTIFARLFSPDEVTAGANGSSPDSSSAWAGGRKLSDQEIYLLAEKIVEQVKARGPFLSMADFVNRRLEGSQSGLSGSDTPDSRMGALDAAILAAELNSQFASAPIWETTNNQNSRANQASLELNPARSPREKAWGATGFLMQSDILEPLAPAMTARGDTFTIRAYGESRDEQGKIMAKACLEAVVTRSTEFVAAAPLNETNVDQAVENRATDPVLRLNRSSGSYEPGEIANVNQQFGRRFKVINMRWLPINEL